jgi:hypothetical protein
MFNFILIIGAIIFPGEVWIKKKSITPKTFLKIIIILSILETYFIFMIADRYLFINSFFNINSTLTALILIAAGLIGFFLLVLISTYVKGELYTMGYFYQPGSNKINFIDLQNFFTDFFRSTAMQFEVKSKGNLYDYRATEVPIRVFIVIDEGNTVYGFGLIDIDGENEFMIMKLKTEVIDRFDLSEKIVDITTFKPKNEF